MTNKINETAKNSQINQINSQEGFTMFSSVNTAKVRAGWMKGLLSVVCTCLALVGVSGIANALPDLTIQNVQFGSSFTVYGFVANIGDQYAQTKVAVYMQMDFYNCYTGQVASLKKLGKFSPAYFAPGSGVWVKFGPFRVKKGWVLTQAFMMVDPYNQIAENSGDDNTYTAYVNSACSSNSSQVVPASEGNAKNQLNQIAKANPSNAQSQVEVFTLNGQKVFAQATSSAGLTTQELSHTLPNGVYVYTLTIKGANGEVIKKEAHKLTIVR